MKHFGKICQTFETTKFEKKREKRNPLWPLDYWSWFQRHFDKCQKGYGT
jgi:hypothetical protein